AFARGEVSEHEDILASILRGKDPDSAQAFSFNEIVDQVAMLFLAGHETSASALTWTLYLLSISPDIQHAAATEVAETLGEGEACGSVPLAAVKRMGLVRRIFMESMRLYPPVGFLAREVSHDTDMRDKHLPAGASLVVSPWLLHRHEALWDAPHEFCPARFDPKSGERSVPKHAYLPFGMGQRVCIGATFAMQEAVLILAELLRHYHFALAPDFQPDPVGRLTIRSDNGMHLVLKKRQAEASA
ncbi:MAG: cytochrome P450, partial [Halothiobacillaceae bacterium]|nr:cytochrome P450 [Halothiobacillaceae bacterium]